MGATPNIVTQVRTGTESVLGGRLTQQDAFVSHPNIFSSDKGQVHLFCVFDGHGSEGHKVSGHCMRAFPNIVVALKEELIDAPETAFAKAFSKVHETLLVDTSIDSYMSGTTAVVCLVVGSRVFVANVGDSRLIVVSQDGQAKQITIDHTCELESEKQRIISKGGRIEQLYDEKLKRFDGPLRIFKGSLPYPGIVVTRSIGDACATKLGVLYEPEIFTFELKQDDRYLVLATDGLWDGITCEQAGAFVSKIPTASEAAPKLTQYGWEQLQIKEIDDNITTVVVGLSNGQISSD
ncbi:phosphatase 2C-like domain-containing protein [Gorgonomyces haynaldii]|nr:phosphatase 2C-like domain-containing protein [Gorgonomyces haynaldii]